MTRDALFTAQWNNRFTMWLGTLFFAFIALTVFTSVLSDGEAFRGLVLIGCLF